LSDSERTSGAVSIGVLSDTHGHLYPQVMELLKGVDHIIHAGDIGSPQVLAGLKTIASVTAVRGNCDLDVWALSLPIEAELELGGVRILVGHIAGRLRETLAPQQSRAGGFQAGCSVGRPGFRVVVSGHTHKMESLERNGVLHLNPGSAGPERFGHPQTLARLLITPASEAPPAQGRAPAQVSVEFFVVPLA
jgi:putative phosphoesterase